VKKLKLKKVLAVIIAIIQICIGILAILFAYLIENNPDFFPLMTFLNIVYNHRVFFILTSLTAGILAIISGLVIFYEFFR
jgi:hypothetical protein